MIVHVVDAIESGPKGLIALLEAHDGQRSLAVEAERLDKTQTTCQVVDCPYFVSYAVRIHRRHSRREVEDLVLCHDDLERHRSGEQLRVVLESNR